jgi:hypothetical protein
MEAAIFVTFIVIQFAAKELPEKCGERFRNLAIVQHIRDNHWVVWLMHPAVLHGLHDYVIHFVVYSGYVIRAH